MAKAAKTLLPWVNSLWNRVCEHSGRGLLFVRFPDCRFESSITIAPSKIDTMARIKQRDVNTSSIFIGGNWEPLCIPFVRYSDSNVRYISCRQVLVEHKDIRHTPESEYLRNVFKKHGKVRNLTSEKAIEQYLLGIQEMYFAIEKAGKISAQEEIFGPKFGEEISFAINSNLELVKVDGGHHRFAAAVTLGLPTVPAQVRKIHTDCIPYIQQHHGGGIVGVRDFIVSVVANYQ